jgi:beta-galactosidase
MAAAGAKGQNAAAAYKGTPFLTAEVGGGVQDTYFRRPQLSADDIAAVGPVMLGSGANLLGYYMFHGGRNPDGGSITLQESQRTAYPTDVPVKSYDFQAPLGEFGQERPSLRKLKLVDYFLNDFGDLLAPMQVSAPDKLPASPSDLSVPRVSARTNGDAGFIFFNNHLRGAQMPARQGFQVRLRLPDGELRVPESPIELPAESYGIWPVNLDLQGVRLRYSTAQLFKRIDAHGQTYFFFFAVDGVQPEWMFDSGVAVSAENGAVEQTPTAMGLRVRAPGNAQAELQLSNKVHLVLLPLPRAEEIWRTDDPSQLLETAADAFSDASASTLQFDISNDIPFAVFGSSAAPATENATVSSGQSSSGQDDTLFRRYIAHVSAIHLQAEVTKVRDASARPPLQMGAPVSWRPQPIPMAPESKDFEGAARWNVTLPPIPQNAAVSNIFLYIGFQGDVARLVADGHLLDDNFWNGLPWEIGLRELGMEPQSTSQKLQIQILSMLQNSPMVIDHADELKFEAGQASRLTSVAIIPQYQVVLRWKPGQ